uniref:Uncharacterized protein n=1 Tax=Candidatus Kentrum sp. FM TaxID=2126340 RepID=A0A450TBZ6_9GAMM|nr:MAG: hypothetical protein BECKFM1743C_GA0114222_103675 [Candidatus Kentron sp. FM]VFJ64851.1 MAG: hypothetical protein BECKFM1743A_GA0114220_103655 [Candidatus Kentron sp. FM]VFK15334.1 MAG: hypothetical protein BECKFM1743B_GA0114221_103665 [Candidatus Kentron sp. FM]
MTARVSDLSVDELRAFIQEVVHQTLIELLHDPDDGLELDADFTSELRSSLNAVQAGGELLSAERVAADPEMIEKTRRGFP